MLKNNIRKILLEETNKVSERLAKSIISLGRKNAIKNSIELSEHLNMSTQWLIEKLGNSDEEFIKNLKTDFLGRFADFSSLLYSILIFDTGNKNLENPLLQNLNEIEVIKSVIEYVINYGTVDKKLEFYVVDMHDIRYFIEDNYFQCDDKFFEWTWDVLLSDPRSGYGKTKKELFWGEIESEVIEKMEDEEWQEETGVTFDSLEREKSYFLSYWHYPLDSLGWDKDQLCDYYKDILGNEKVKDTILTYESKNLRRILINGNIFYIINKNLFI